MQEERNKGRDRLGPIRLQQSILEGRMKEGRHFGCEVKNCQTSSGGCRHSFQGSVPSTDATVPLAIFNQLLQLSVKVTIPIVLIPSLLDQNSRNQEETNIRNHQAIYYTRYTRHIPFTKGFPFFNWIIAIHSGILSSSLQRHNSRIAGI